VGVKPGLGLPWRRGPGPLTRPVWVTATRFIFTTTWAAAAAGPHALRFWTRWAEVPGAIGLAMRYQPWPRAAWTITVWSRKSDLDIFLHGPAHRAVVRSFHDRLSGTSHGWESTEFDLGRAWSRAIDVLSPKVIVPPRGTPL
jgi:hypothetical protein